MTDQLSGKLSGLDDSEGFYHQLITAMNEGLCLHEIIYDGMGRPEDFRILDVNP